MVDILKCSLSSTTPLTDVLLRKKDLSSKKGKGKSLVDIDVGEVEAEEDGSGMMKVKIVIRKSKFPDLPHGSCGAHIEWEYLLGYNR
jgi:hypothetical protein